MANSGKGRCVGRYPLRFASAIALVCASALVAPAQPHPDPPASGDGQAGDAPQLPFAPAAPPGPDVVAGAAASADEGEQPEENLLAGDDDENLLAGDSDVSFEEIISFEDPLVGYVVVTGAKRRKRTSESLASVSVLTQEQVEGLPYFFLGDLLSVLPGVDARWGMMQRYYVGVRGLGSTTSLNSRMLLLWDGVPMNDPFTGELSAGHFVPLVDVERVELIRGAGSSMYGGNAFSGVVNVVTRDPAELVPREGVRASSLLGSFLTSRLQVAADQNLGGLHVGSSVEAFRTDGPFPVVDRQTPEEFTRFKNDDVSSVASEAHVAYEGIQIRGQYVYGDRGKPGTFVTDADGHMRACENCHTESEWGRGEKYPATTHSCGTCHATPQDRETSQRGGVAVLYNRWLGGGFKVSSQAYDNEYRTRYRSMKEDAFLTLYEDKIDLKQRATGGETYVSHSSRRNEAVLGVALRRTEAVSQMIETDDGADGASLVNVAGFFEDEFHPTDWLAATAGVRTDNSTLFGTAISPRGGVVIRPASRLHLRAATARSFRNPLLSELYVYERRGKYTVRGNPDLDRERMSSTELGLNYAFEPREKMIVRVGAVGYLNTTSELIGITATGRDVATFANTGTAEVRGMEVEGELVLKTSPTIRGTVNYSFQDADDKDGEVLPYAPQSKGNAVLIATGDRWGLLLRARAVGKRWDEMRVALPGFATLDVSGQLGLGRGLSLRLWANNLNDDDRQESLGIPRARRSFFLTLGYRDD